MVFVGDGPAVPEVKGVCRVNALGWNPVLGVTAPLAHTGGGSAPADTRSPVPLPPPWTAVSLFAHLKQASLPGPSLASDIRQPRRDSAPCPQP